MDQHSSESNYFKRRASEERAAAQRARDPRARQSHIDLAERYSHAAGDGRLIANDEASLESSVGGPLLQPEFRILP